MFEVLLAPGDSAGAVCEVTALAAQCSGSGSCSTGVVCMPMKVKSAIRQSVHAELRERVRTAVCAPRGMFNVERGQVAP